MAVSQGSEGPLTAVYKWTATKLTAAGRNGSPIEWLPLLLVALNSAMIFYWFLPEFRHASLSWNDGVLHISMVRRLDTVWDQGGDVFDFWYRTVAGGHAFMRASHCLLYFIVWLIHQTLAMTIESAFYAVVLAAVCLLPWSFYAGARLLGLSAIEGAFSGFLLSIVADRAGLGVGLFNYSFTGHGLYSQMFALLFFPIALGLARRALAGAGGIPIAAIFCALTWTSHIFVGYMSFFWIAADALLIAIARPQQWRKVAGRWLGLNCLLGLFASGLFIPLLQDRILQHKSPWEPAYRWVGHGIGPILSDLASGRWFDSGGGFPVVTVLALVGWVSCVAALISKKGGRDGFYPAGLAVHIPLWLALNFGPATWGEAAYLLPFSSHLQWDRFIIAAQVALIFCASVGASRLHRYFASWHNDKVWPALVILGLCLPNLRASHAVMTQANREAVLRAEKSWSEDKDLHAIKDFALDRRHWDARYDPGYGTNYGATMSAGPFSVYSVLSEFNVNVISVLYHCLAYTSVVTFTSTGDVSQDARLRNIRYVALPNDMLPPNAYKKIFQGDKITLYDNGNQEGFFAIGSLGQPGCADNDEFVRATTSWIQGGGYDRKVFPAINLADDCSGAVRLSDVVAQISPKSANGEILATGVEPGRESRRHWAKVRMDRPGLLVFKMAYHPFWRVLVDGQKAATVMVVPGYIGIPLERGEFNILAEYISSQTRKRLFLFGFLAAVAALFWERRRALTRAGNRP